MTRDPNKIVRCNIDDRIANIVMDDGKSNVVSLQMLRQLNEALDRAEQANAVVVLTGRDDMFCAGFDLKVLKHGVLDAFKMLVGGFKLSRRLLGFPTPVVIARSGHAMAMGSFLLLSGDYRIGADGPSKIAANEVAIGLTIPYSAIVICRQRLKQGHFDRAVLLSEEHTPQSAVDAGFLDRVVGKEVLMDQAREQAQQYAQTLDAAAHRDSKQRMRRKLLRQLSWALWADRVSFVWLGFRRLLK